MERFQDEILEVEDLGVRDEFVYDIGMLNTPHTFFADDILVHNSMYLSYSKLFDSIGYEYRNKSVEVVKNFIMFNKDMTNLEVGGLSKEERKNLEETSKSLQNLISSFIDKLMVKFSKSLNCCQNRISFKREAIAARAIFLERKRYVYWVLNSEGVEMDKLKSTGVEIVRSSTPILVQKYLKNIIFDILRKLDPLHAEAQIRDFREKFFKADPESIAFPKTVNNLDSYVEKISNGDAKSIPINVRASIVYNNAIKNSRNLKNIYDYIYEADKMKFVYMKTNNEWQDNVLGFKDKWPKELNLDSYIDYELQFRKTFLGPIERFYGLLNWSMPNLENKNVQTLFEW